MKKLIFLLAIFLFPKTTRAALEQGLIPSDMYDKFAKGDFEWSDIIAFVMHLIQYLLELSGILAVILLMYGGFQYIFGAVSDDENSGKQTIKSTLIGLAVILMAWIIVDIAVSLLTTTSV